MNSGLKPFFLFIYNTALKRRAKAFFGTGFCPAIYGRGSKSRNNPALAVNKNDDYLAFL